MSLSSFFVAILSAALLTSVIASDSQASRFFRSKETQQRIQERLNSNGRLPTGIDGRCYPTCLTTICTDKIPAVELYDAIAWCKNFCHNSKRAASATASPDYPANVCKNKIPPFDPDQRKWEQLRAQYMDPNMSHSRAMDQRKQLNSTTGFLPRTGQAFKRVYEGGFKALNCDFCRDPKQVCGSSPKAQELRQLCVNRCWTAKWVRDITTYQPGLADAEKDNLKENMNLFIKGLCTGRDATINELKGTMSQRPTYDEYAVKPYEGNPYPQPTRQQPIQRWGYGMQPDNMREQNPPPYNPEAMGGASFPNPKSPPQENFNYSVHPQGGYGTSW